MQGRAEKALGFRPGGYDYAAGAIIIASFLLFFAPVVFAGEVFYFRDICQEIVPKRWFLTRSQGEVLWNPYGFFGLPLAANSQWAAFYPLNFIFAAGAASRSVSFYIVFHFLVALSGTYVLVRSLGKSWAAALAGSLAFAYGGFLMSAGVQVVVLSSAAWITWLLWSARQGLRTGRIVFAAGLGIFWALQVLGGEPEIAYLTGIVLAFFCAAMYFDKEHGTSGSKYLIRCIKICGVGLVLALAISAVQWVITLDFVAVSNRAGGVDYSSALKWSLPPESLLTLFFPHNIRDPSQGQLWVLGFFNLEYKLPYLLSIYPGITVLALAAFGVASERRKGAVMAAGAFVFLLLSLGDHGFLYRLFHLVLPGFDRFRFPEKCLYGFAVLIALLCALGIENIYTTVTAGRKNGDEKAPAARGLRKTLPFMLIAAGAIALVRSLTLAGGAEPSASAAPSVLDEFHIKLISASIIQSAGLLGILAGTVLSARRGLIKRLPAVFFICLVIVADLYLAHCFVNPTAEPRFYSLEDNIARGISPGTRVAVFPSPDKADMWLGRGDNVEEFFKNQRKWVQPFTGLELKLRDAGAKSSFYHADADLWLAMIKGKSQQEKERLFALSGIKWVIKPGSPPYKIKDALPRAYVTPQVEFVAGRDEALSRVQSPSFDPRSTTVLEGETPEHRQARPGPVFWNAPVLEETNHYMAIMVETDNPGYLVLLDSFMPGWRARMNGEELPLYRANGFFRAVPVDKARGVVEFFYRPVPFYAGLAVSLAGVAACLVILFRKRAGVLLWPLWFVVLAVLPLVKGGTHYVPVTALKIIVLVMAAAWAWKIMRERNTPFLRTRLDLCAALFWLLAAYAFMIADYFYISLYWHLNIVTYIILFYVTVQFAGEEGRREKRVRWVMAIIVFSALVQSAWALEQYIAAYLAEDLGSQDRASGGFKNPAYLAGYIMAVSPYVLARSLGALRNPGGKGLVGFGAGILVFLVLVAGALVTRSRALVVWPLPLFLVSVPGLQGVFEAYGMDRRRSLRRSLVAMCAAAVLGAVLLALVPNPLRERVLNIGTDKYAFERPKIWASSLEMIKDHPLGVGPGMYKYYSHQYKFPVEGVVAGRYERTANYAHNQYLQIAAEMSPLAALLVVAALVLLLWGGIKNGWHARHGPMITGLAAGVLSLGLHALFDHNLQNHALAVLAVVLSALLLGELSSESNGWVLPVDPGKRTRLFFVAVFSLAAAAGTPAYLALAHGFGQTLSIRDAEGLRQGAFRADRAARHSYGSSVPFKFLGEYLTSEYKTNNPKLLEKAHKAAQKAVELNPADPAARGLEARIMFFMYRSTGHKPLLDKALEKIERALELAPYNVDYHMLAAREYRLAGNRQKQLAHLQRSLELEPYDLGARLRLTRALLTEGGEEEARRQWHEFHRRRRRVRKNDNISKSSYRQRRADYEKELYIFLQRKLGVPK